MTAPGLYPEHDLFIQHTKLKNTLRWMMGEDQITHLGREYYDWAPPVLTDSVPLRCAAGPDQRTVTEPERRR